MTVAMLDYGTTRFVETMDADCTPLTAPSVVEVWGGEVEALDPLVLTMEKALARDAEGRTADRSRFRPWSDVRNALRNQSL